jgi:hypothetical protein
MEFASLGRPPLSLVRKPGGKKKGADSGIYRPHAEVLSGAWSFPKPQPVE